MEIRVYLHRTKKKEFQVADCFSVFVDLDKLPEDKKEDLDYINQGFSNDCQRIARTRECVKKYGTAYLSFMRPQYEGPDKDNGNGKVYFDNREMLFKAVADKPKKPKKGIVKAVSKETKTEEATNEKE